MGRLSDDFTACYECRVVMDEGVVEMMYEVIKGEWKCNAYCKECARDIEYGRFIRCKEIFVIGRHVRQEDEHRAYYYLHGINRVSLKQMIETIKEDYRVSLDNKEWDTPEHIYDKIIDNTREKRDEDFVKWEIMPSYPNKKRKREWYQSRIEDLKQTLEQTQKELARQQAKLAKWL